MILSPTISRVLETFAAGQPVPQPLIDFVRPFFLKNDPANGAEQFADILADPATDAHQNKLKHVLRDQLAGNEEGVEKLLTLLPVPPSRS